MTNSCISKDTNTARARASSGAWRWQDGRRPGVIKIIIAFVLGVWFGVTMAACVIVSRDEEE